MFLVFQRNARIEHLSTNRVTTLCGLDTQGCAVFRASERGQDAKVRPLCPNCRSAK